MKRFSNHCTMPTYRLKGLAIFVVITGFLIGSISTAAVRADSFQDQIDNLNTQNDQKQAALNTLASQAADYQDAINKLQQQVAGLQSAIADNQVRQADLQAQIVAAQERLDHEKQVLGEDLKAMYVGGRMSTVEMLATSKNLSAFVDAETYSSAVQNKIQKTMDEIAGLQKQLKDQKAQVEQLIVAERQQETDLGNEQSQQTRLLAMDESQQADYNNQLKANQAKIAELRAEQAAANARLLSSGSVSVLSSGSCGGGYPNDATGSYGHWGCSYGLDDGVDSWGMLNRECVSYTAWKVYQRYGSGVMPNWGAIPANADNWPSDARSYGIPTGSTPRIDSVAIGTNPYWFGPVGHAMWVEAVSGDKILVSQMNFSGPGRYSEMWVDTNLINTFIYFGS